MMTRSCSVAVGYAAPHARSLLAPESPLSAPASAAGITPAVGSRIPWQGTDWYLSGVNVPWFNWGCDFGCVAAGGVSDPSVQVAVIDALDVR